MERGATSGFVRICEPRTAPLIKGCDLRTENATIRFKKRICARLVASTKLCPRSPHGDRVLRFQKPFSAQLVASTKLWTRSPYGDRDLRFQKPFSALLGIFQKAC